MRDPLVAEVGRRIRELRTARGLSQERLAEAAGLTLESISRAERGASEISITSLARVCEALRIDLAGFFGKTKVPKSNRAPRQAEQIAALLRNRTPREARRVLAIVRLVLAR